MSPLPWSLRLLDFAAGESAAALELLLQSTLIIALGLTAGVVAPRARFSASLGNLSRDAGGSRCLPSGNVVDIGSWPVGGDRLAAIASPDGRYANRARERPVQHRSQ